MFIAATTYMNITWENRTHSIAAAPMIFNCELNFNFYLASKGKVCLEKPAG